MQPIIQPVNVAAAFDGALLLRRQQLAFIVGAIRAAEPEREQPLSVTSPTPALVTVAPTTSLPPDWVIQRESGGDYTAYNPNGCADFCYGKYQFSSDWGGKLGLPEDIRQATPEQQDEAARQLWANGAGCQNWSACN